MNKESSVEKCVLIPFIKYQRLLKQQQQQQQQQQQIGSGEILNKPALNENKPEIEVKRKVHILPPPPGKTDTVAIQDKSEINSWIDNWESIGFLK